VAVGRETGGRLGGEIEVETERGRGTRFRIRLPLTVAISDALTVNVGPQTLAIPVSAVKGAVVLRPEQIRTTDGVESVEIEGENVELVRLDRLLQIPEPEARGALSIVTLRTGRRTLAVVVDEFLSKEEIVIKNLGTFLQGVGPFSGATVTGQGRVILLLDSLKLLDMSAAASWPHAVEEIRPEPEAAAAPVVDARRRIMLVDDSLSVRKFVGGMLERAGFHVTTARDGAEALQQLAELTVDVLITDLEMPRLNGYELIRGLSRQPTTRDLPVVILTTRAGAKHVNLARELGVEHYVAKPVDEASFVQLIEVLAVATWTRAGSWGHARDAPDRSRPGCALRDADGAAAGRIQRRHRRDQRLVRADHARAQSARSDREPLGCPRHQRLRAVHDHPQGSFDDGGAVPAARESRRRNARGHARGQARPDTRRRPAGDRHRLRGGAASPARRTGGRRVPRAARASPPPPGPP